MKAAAPQPVSGRRWLFRLVALVGIPVLTLALLEGALRLGGYGYSTRLLEKEQINGHNYLLNNEKFSLRFFPPELSRWPSPIMFEPVKPAGTYRVFIFGESAAQGDPEPSFGAGRYLEALLRERYPNLKIEVINVAITAINSHVILPIARECAQYQGDLWIIYMGNNEMIGPFGAATVFGAKAPAWPLVRLSLALQETRIGQLLAAFIRRLKGKSSSPAVWGGLQMFLGNQLAPDDPRKEVVYKNFQRNLKDILRAGRECGAGIILNTVAVNLKDCPPFASVSSGALSAETEFQAGTASLQSNDVAAAAAHFEKARDLDALPFRADSRINDIIRATARQMARPNLVLCDAAARLPGPGKIAGQETFYEHVHFNFDGNYRLARLWAEQAETFLPRSSTGWASQGICERRLGLTDWNRSDVLGAVRQRFQRPPLNNQVNNNERLAALNAWLDRLIKGRTSEAAAQARALYAQAIARAPQDYLLHENFGEFLELTGDARPAAEEWKQARTLMPRNPFACLAEGQLRERLGEMAQARDCLQDAIRLHPRYAEAWLELGKLAATENKLDEAMSDYRQSAALQPNDPQTYVYMGKALSLFKRSDESLQSFRHALELDDGNWEAHYALGGELGMHGQIAEARSEFERVVQLEPEYAMGHLNLGVALLKLNDVAGARQQFSEALRLDPGNRAARSYLATISK